MRIKSRLSNVDFSVPRFQIKQYKLRSVYHSCPIKINFLLNYETIKVKVVRCYALLVQIIFLSVYNCRTKESYADDRFICVTLFCSSRKICIINTREADSVYLVISFPCNFHTTITQKLLTFCFQTLFTLFVFISILFNSILFFTRMLKLTDNTEYKTYFVGLSKNLLNLFKTNLIADQRDCKSVTITRTATTFPIKKNKMAVVLYSKLTSTHIHLRR